MAELKKMFKTKPGCFGKYNKDWTLCTQQCNFRMDCMKNQIRTEHKENRRKIVSRHSVSKALDNGRVDRKSNESLEDFYERDWEKRMSRQGISYVPKTTPKRKPKPKVRVFHMPPPKPQTRLVFGSVTDVNMAIMFGLYKYGEAMLKAVPSEVAEEYDRLLAVPDDTYQMERMEKLKLVVDKHWNSWEKFMEFMKT